MVKLRGILALLFCILETITFAKNYYVSNTGDDTADGLTQQSTWKTISKINEFKFSPGDSILFKRGDTWREQLILTSSGSSGNHIVISSYGSGAKPRILGSNTTTEWTIHSENVWKSNSIFANFDSPNDRIWFISPNSTTWGVWESAGIGSLDAEYEYNYSNDIIYVYSTSDPSVAYTSIEVPIIEDVISLQSETDSAEYYTFDGLEVAYFGHVGIGTDWPGGISDNSTRAMRGFEVRNCYIHHGNRKDGPDGYGILVRMSDVIIENNEIHDMGRRGLSILADGFIYSTILENIVIQDNYFHTGWHTTGPDIINSDDVCVFDNIIIRRNIIEDDPTLPISGGMGAVGIYIGFIGSGSAAIQNVWIYNNLIKNPKGGGGIQVENVDDLYIHNNTIYLGNQYDGTGILTTGASDFAIIRNNIIYSNNRNSQCLSVSNSSGYHFDYNLYYSKYPTSYNSFVYVNPTAYRQSDWFSYRSATGWDGNSPNPADPRFISSSDFHLHPESNMIDKGIDVGLPYNGDAPDLGAFEFINGTPTIPINTGIDFDEGSPTIVELYFDMELTSSVVPTNSDFTVVLNGSTYFTVTSVNISDTIVRLTLASAVTTGGTLSVSYSKTGVNTLQTPAGGEVESFTRQTNVNIEGPPPEEDFSVRIFQYPTGNYLAIHIGGSPITVPHFIRFYNTFGELVYGDKIDTNASHIPISFSPGVYLVDIGIGDQILYSQRIILDKK